MALDPLAIPIATIMKPFKIDQLKPEEAVYRKSQKKTIKDFFVKEQFFKAIDLYNLEKSSIRI